MFDPAFLDELSRDCCGELVTRREERCLPGSNSGLLLWLLLVFSRSVFVSSSCDLWLVSPMLLVSPAAYILTPAAPGLPALRM